MTQRAYRIEHPIDTEAANVKHYGDGSTREVTYEDGVKVVTFTFVEK